ncbi:MAG: hypothetical protein K1Y02_00205 [Candidatus Hydrogenedentes bacterium]|nr:hypothetical protein [Candidatus Hydrogenedentota bacterium]
MRSRIVSIAALVGTVLAGAGCLSDGGSPPPPTQLELRGFQTREYDTQDMRLVMKAMVNVLQDMGFIINNADTQLGLLSANKMTDIAHSKREIKRAQKKEELLSKTLVLDCTANVSAFGKQSRVRVNFQQRVLGTNGATMSASPITDAAFYQQFFAQVDKGIFLQQEGV